MAPKEKCKVKERSKMGSTRIKGFESEVGR